MRDIGLPLGAAIAVGALMRALMPAALDRTLTVGYLFLSTAAVFAIVFALTPDVRAAVMERVRAALVSHTAARADPR